MYLQLNLFSHLDIITSSGNPFVSTSQYQNPKAVTEIATKIQNALKPMALIKMLGPSFPISDCESIKKTQHYLIVCIQSPVVLYLFFSRSTVVWWSDLLWSLAILLCWYIFLGPSVPVRLASNHYHICSSIMFLSSLFYFTVGVVLYYTCGVPFWVPWWFWYTHIVPNLYTCYYLV